ncbi:hypothetical protein X943_003419 [Babesia divergens]|uniref:Uncharacterized protein n=1 Tax=Babesia divergens TaxID=32595 RepID=A0AAD9G9L6_BABDI|nr:hypothetical protein X943_003419 [Babesia divergens]
MGIVSEACCGPKKQQSYTIVLEVVAPLLEVIDSFTPKLQYNLMSSLTLLPQTREFAGSLQPIIHNIIGDLFRDPWETEYLGLLKTICLDEDNVTDVMHYGVAAYLIGEMCKYQAAKGSLYADSADIPRICDLLDVIGFTLGVAGAYVLSEFTSEVLMPNLKYLIGDREGTSRLTPPQARVCNMIIRLCMAIAHTAKPAFDELCFGYHLFDLLLVPVKEPVADPLVLTAALYGISFIMENPENGETFANAFTEEVNIVLLLTYLKPERLENLSATTTGHADDLMCSVANFIAHLLGLSKMYSSMRQLTDMMYEKGLAITVLDALASGAIDRKVSGAFVRILSRFSIDKIDAMAIRIMLELMTPANVMEFEPEVFGYMVSALEQKLESYSMEAIIEKVCWLLVFTLKTVDARRYEVVQLRCASLLQTASKTHTGRLLLGEEHNSLAIRKALKYEQDFCAFDHADIRVELSSVGRDVNFLNACMFDTFRLKHDHRQIFRVLRALGKGLIDTEQDVAEEELLAIDAICASEVEDFVERPKHIAGSGGAGGIPLQTVGHSSLSDAESETTSVDGLGASITSDAPEQDTQSPEVVPMEPSAQVHRDQQRQLFISLDMAKKIVSYLSGAFSPTFTELYQRERKYKQHSEYWAGVLKGRKIDCEQFSIVDKFDWSIKCDEVFDGDKITEDVQMGGTVCSAIAKPSRQLVSYVIGQKLGGVVMHNTDDPFFSVLPSQMLHKVWINESNSVLNPCFVVSAFLRILYGLMAPSVSHVVSDVIKGHFRQPEFVRSLIKLTACSSFLDANITAKLFKTCARALTIDASVQAESMDMIIVYDILSQFAKGLCEPLKGIVTAVSVNWAENNMEHAHMVLLNVFRMLALFAKQTPWIKFSNVLEIQEYFVETCIIRFIPESFLGLVLQILFQIVALETSSSVGTYVSHLYQSELLEQLRECCVDMAVAVSCAAKNTHYTFILNAISEQRNFKSLLLRPSLVADLLRRIYLTEVRKRFQEFVIKKEWNAFYSLTTYGTIKDKLIALTSRAIHILNVKSDESFKITSKFDASATVWSIDDGLLHAILPSAPAADKPDRLSREWALFTLRHTAPPNFARFVTAEAKDILRQYATRALGAAATYLGICQCDDSLCLVAVTQDKLAILAVQPALLVARIMEGRNTNYQVDTCSGEPYDDHRDTSKTQGKDARSNEVETGRSSGESSEMTSEGTRDEPLHLLHECYCDDILRVSYKELDVTFSLKEPEDETRSLTFASDSRCEAFKKALARAIGHLAWYRRWE